MQEQIIKINVPEGKRAVYNEQTQVIEFVNIEPIRSKSWDEFCKNHPNTRGEWYIQNDSTIDTWNYYTTSERRDIYRNNLATEEDAEAILALIQLTRLHDEWIGSWKPDWEDSKVAKFSIYSYEGKIDILTTTLSQRLLVFPSFPMAQEFYDCFIDLIKKAKKFI